MPANRQRTEGFDRSADNVLSLCSSLFGLPAGLLSDAELWAAERELGIALPPSYQTFLRYYGSGVVGSLKVYGLPRDRLWLDVVLLNQCNPRLLSFSLVKIAEDGAGSGYYLDVARAEDGGEYPVLGHARGEDKVLVADNFMEFLKWVDAGLGLRIR